MKNSILFLLLILIGTPVVWCQFERQRPVYEFGKIVKGDYSNMNVVPNYPAEKSKMQYEFYGQSNAPYQDSVNKQIVRYVHELLVDTAYIPIEKQISPKFFEDALNNFLESDRYIRFQLGEDIPPFWVNMSIQIDTTTLQHSVLLNAKSSIYVAGAHPNSFDQYFVIDKTSGQILTWEKLLTNREKFMNVAEKYFKKVEKIGRKKPIPTIQNKDEPSGKNTILYFFQSGKFELPRFFTFTKKKMLLLYQPYEAREWARGEIRIELPIKKINKFIRFSR